MLCAAAQIRPRFNTTHPATTATLPHREFILQNSMKFASMNKLAWPPRAQFHRNDMTYTSLMKFEYPKSQK